VDKGMLSYSMSKTLISEELTKVLADC